MSHSLPRRRSGFSMVEMLIVFVVFAVVVSIAMRSVSGTIRQDRVGKVASLLSADVEQAFALAARQRRPVRLIVDSVNQVFSVVDRISTTTIYKTRSFKTSGDLQLDFISPATDTVDIMPSGLATKSMTLVLGITTTGTSKFKKTLRVSKAGLVTVDNR